MTIRVHYFRVEKLLFSENSTGIKILSFLSQFSVAKFSDLSWHRERLKSWLHQHPDGGSPLVRRTDGAWRSKQEAGGLSQLHISCSHKSTSNLFCFLKRENKIANKNVSNLTTVEWCTQLSLITYRKMLWHLWSQVLCLIVYLQNLVSWYTYKECSLKIPNIWFWKWLLCQLCHCPIEHINFLPISRTAKWWARRCRWRQTPTLSTWKSAAPSLTTETTPTHSLIICKLT